MAWDSLLARQLLRARGLLSGPVKSKLFNAMWELVKTRRADEFFWVVEYQNENMGDVLKFLERLDEAMGGHELR